MTVKRACKRTVRLRPFKTFSNAGNFYFPATLPKEELGKCINVNCEIALAPVYIFFGKIDRSHVGNERTMNGF
jgi:hypothetical protein